MLAHRDTWFQGVNVTDAKPVPRYNAAFQALWAFKAAKGDAVTHTFMTGGNLHVEDSQLEAFLKAHIAAVVTAGANPYALPTISERIPKDAHYRFFADIDAKMSPQQVAEGIDGVELTTPTHRRNALLSFARACAGWVSEAYVCTSPLQVIIMSAAEETQEDGAIKVGLHVVMPEVTVDQSTAQAIYTHIKAKLSAHLDDKPELAAFLVAALDEAPLKNGGMRLPFAGKGAKQMAPCVSCNDACSKKYLHKKDHATGRWLPQRVMAAGRPYQPLEVGYVFPPDDDAQEYTYKLDDNDLQLFLDNPLMLLKACILKQPPSAQLTQGLTFSVAPPQSTKSAGTKRKRGDDTEKPSKAAAEWETIELDTEQVAALQGALLALPAMAAYKTARVGKVARKPHGGAGADEVVIALDGTTVCPHTGEAHASNRPYLCLQGHFATLRCHDEDCSEFQSAPFAVPQEVEALVRSTGPPAGFTFVPSSIMIDDAFAARELARLLGSDVILDRDRVYAFDDTRGLWSPSPELLKRIATRAGPQLIFELDCKKNKKISYSGSVTHQGHMLQMLPHVLPRNDGYFTSSTALTGDVKKMLFSDGIYDFETAVFTPGFDRNIIFRAGVPCKFYATRVVSDIAWVHRAMFEEPFRLVDGKSEDAERLKHELMRGLIGDFLRKKYMIELGDTNTGKGTQVCAMKNMLGSDLVFDIDVNKFITRHFPGDPAKELGWALAGEMARFWFSNEGRVTQGEVIDASILNKLTGGGDVCTAKLNYAVHEVHFVPKALIVILCNDMPALPKDNSALRARTNVVNYDYSFVSAPKLEHQKMADNDIKKKLSTPAAAAALWWILVDVFNAWKAGGYIELPDSARHNAAVEAVMPVTDFRVLLEEAGYEITGVDTDMVPSATLMAVIRRSDDNLTNTAIGRGLNAFLGPSFNTTLNGKSINMRRGIVLKTIAVEV